MVRWPMLPRDRAALRELVDFGCKSATWTIRPSSNRSASGRPAADRDGRLADRSSRRDRSVMGDEAQRSPSRRQIGAVERVAQSRGALRDRVEDRLDVRRRSGDDRRISRGRRLLLERSVRSLLRASSSVNSRTFSTAITAWSAKVLSSSIWLSENPPASARATAIAPIGSSVAQHRNRDEASVGHRLRDFGDAIGRIRLHVLDRARRRDERWRARPRCPRRPAAEAPVETPPVLPETAHRRRRNGGDRPQSAGRSRTALAETPRAARDRVERGLDIGRRAARLL